MIRNRKWGVWGITVLLMVLLPGCRNAEGERGYYSIISSEQADEAGTAQDHDKGIADNGQIRESEEAESVTAETWIELNGGVRVTSTFTVPHDNWRSIPLLHVEQINYDGETIIPGLLDVENLAELKNGTLEPMNGDGLYYEGLLGQVSGCQNGELYAGSSLYLETEHWDTSFRGQPSYGIGMDESKAVFPDVQESSEFTFASKENAVRLVQQLLRESVGIETQLEYVYPFNYHELEAMAELHSWEDMGKPVEEKDYIWSEKDDCYYIKLKLLLQGVPLLSRRVTRQDDLYIGSGYVEIGVTCNGIEFIKAHDQYKIKAEEKVELVSIEEIYDSIEKKLSSSITGAVAVDEMTLIYYPILTQGNKDENRQFDCIPAWECHAVKGEYSQYYYFSAVNGSELVG